MTSEQQEGLVPIIQRYALVQKWIDGIFVFLKKNCVGPNSFVCREKLLTHPPPFELDLPVLWLFGFDLHLFQYLLTKMTKQHTLRGERKKRKHRCFLRVLKQQAAQQQIDQLVVGICSIFSLFRISKTLVREQKHPHFPNA